MAPLPSKDTSKFLQHGAKVLGLGNSKIFILSLRPPFVSDIRHLFATTSEEDNELFNYYLKGIEVSTLGKLGALRRIAERVNKHLTYQSDQKTYGKPEYWASPMQIHKKAIDDCDGSALLICYLARLIGFSPLEIFVRAGDTAAGPHAHVIWFDWDLKEWFPVEGSLNAKECLGLLGRVPMRYNPTYQDQSTYYITNDELSFSTYPIRLVR